MTSEFALIHRHFTRPTRYTRLAIGDDAALFAPEAGMELAVSTDMLVEGTHFFSGTPPGDLGWKTLAVNLSDLAAMGAQPRWALLALALPKADEGWLQAFSQGFFDCAKQYDVELIGGDTTRGPLNLCVTLFGEVPTGQAITRAGAQAGDDIWITGWPGRAALGLAHLREQLHLPAAQLEACLSALHHPVPRVEAGLALRSVASAMLDVSDGLLGDLAHILAQSHVGAIIDDNLLPFAPLAYAGASEKALHQALLNGGDDYELLFCAPPHHRASIARLAAPLGLPITRIGVITDSAQGLLLRHASGQSTPPIQSSHDHFR